jgi:disulfide bond formation protein DsbB
MAVDPGRTGGWWYLFVAWSLALAGTLGALFIGEVMGKTPCDLCWLQRAFMFPLALVLAVGAYRGDIGAWRYALPLAVTGAGIAAFHTLLFAGIIPEAIKPCRAGPSCASTDMVLFLIPLPYLSLVAFVGIAALLAIARRKASHV